MIYAVIFVAALILLGISNNIEIILAVLLVYTLPGIVVYCQYYLLNKENIFVVKNEKIFIENKHDRDVQEIEDIMRIDLYAAGDVFKKIEWDAYPVQQYHYIKISTKREVYYVTSIVFDNTIEKRLKQFINHYDAVYHRHKKIVSFVSLS